MTPVTGATFPTAMRRSAPCFGAERQRRTSILLSADAGRARLVSRVPLRPRCRKSGSVLGWRAPDHCLTAVGLGPRGSGPLLKGVGRQPPASSPASEASVQRWRALIRPTGRSSAPARSRLTVGGPAPSALGRSATPASEPSTRRSRALIRPSGRSLALHRSGLAVGGQAPSALGRSAARASEPSSRRSRALIPT